MNHNNEQGISLDHHSKVGLGQMKQLNKNQGQIEHYIFSHRLGLVIGNLLASVGRIRLRLDHRNRFLFRLRLGLEAFDMLLKLLTFGKHYLILIKIANRRLTIIEQLDQVLL